MSDILHDDAEVCECERCQYANRFAQGVAIDRRTGISIRFIRQWTRSEPPVIDFTDSAVRALLEFMRERDERR